MAPERWHTIERLYHDALHRAPNQRHKYLEASCGSDEALRREVEGLLALEERAQGFLEKSALEVASQLERKAPGRSHESPTEFRLAQGARLGPYEILQPLSAGGMGEIYYARDNRLGRAVALKILSGRMLNHPAIRGRLESEARAISSLNHPNICTLHDIGRENDIDYLVMELVEGQTLAQRLKHGPIPYRELLRIAIQISEALDYAHAHGVVHRDLKPGNIMLTERGVKLVDFGLARWRDQAQEFTTVIPTGVLSSLTLTGVVVGTPQYMAPEQIERGPVDGRTDIFALGAVLFEMATGRKAFEGRTSSEVTRAILANEPRTIADLDRSIPPELEQAVRRCLKRSPADRWQFAGELARELARLEARASPSFRLGRILGALAVLAVLAVGLIGRATVPGVQFRHDLKPQILHSLNGSDGEKLIGGLALGPNHVFYGAAVHGGASGHGAAFALLPPAALGRPWVATVLYSFSGTDGYEPFGGLVVGENGQLFGTTRIGGAWGNGTVFELLPPATPGNAWTEKVLHSFTRQNGDAAEPLSTLVMDKRGVLYGTTQAGGTAGGGNGTVFAVSPPTTPEGNWTEQVLYRFGDPEGSNPWAELLIGKAGELYSTTFDGPLGIGTVFKLEPPTTPGGVWKETVLHRFTGENGDGGDSAAGLIIDGEGNLYGATTEGTPGLGSVFKMTPPATPGGTWTETVLHRFTGRNGDGSDVATGLTLGKNGVLYGTTLRGGAFGKGTIFQLTPPPTPGGVWTETVLYSFSGLNGDGVGPKSMPRLFLDASGALFGTTMQGGISNDGTVFKLVP
jgi:uncharacterized repeat protein (TIGR03803 family)